MWRVWVGLAAAALLEAQSIRGIYHGASFLPVQLDGLALGSQFAILGEGFPEDKAQVQVAVQGVLVPVVETATDRIVAVLPETLTPGAVQIQVRIGTRVSTPIFVLAVDRRPGLFTVSKDGRGPAEAYAGDARIGFLNPARAGQEIRLWATGVGAGNPEIRVRVGRSEAVSGQLVRLEDRPGVAEIRVVMPEAEEPGCYVPVVIRIGELESPAVTIAREKCEHPLGLSEEVLRRLDAGELVGFGQLALETSQVDNGGQPVRQEVATASFVQVNGGELYEFASLDLATVAMLPDGCRVTQQLVFASEAVSGDIDFGGVDLPLARRLDAGASLRLTGPAGNVTLDRSAFRTYGRAVAITDGDWTLAGPGGGSVGEFSATLGANRAVSWDQTLPALVDTREQVVLNWALRGDFERDVMIVNGQARALVDRNFGAVTAFTCVLPAKAGTFMIPRSVLDRLPPANVQAGVLQLNLFLGPQTADARFTASGLDFGMFTRQFLLAKSRFYRN